MDTQSTPGTGSVEDELSRFLDTAEPSLVSAADPGGFVLPLPSRLVSERHEPFQVGNIVETLSVDDAPRVIERWERGLEAGERTWSVRARLVDGSEADLWTFDCRAEGGELVVAATPVAGRLDPGVGSGDSPAEETPRICRLEKNDLAAITGVDGVTESMLGWAAEDLLGRRHMEFVHPDDAHLLVHSWVSLMSHPGTSRRIRARHLRKDGSYLWVEMINHNRLSSPEAGHVACDVIDISEQVAAEAALAARERELRALTDMLSELTESLPSGVAQVDPDGQVVYSNSRLFSLLAQQPGAHLDELLTVLTDEETQHQVSEAVRAAARGGEAVTSIEAVAAMPATPEPRVIDFVVRPLRGGRRGAVVSVSDITDTVVRRTDLEWRATRDPLTDCLNRDAVLDAARAALSRPTGESGVALLFVDLDGLKHINDELGHAAGDEMIRLLARRLRQVVRESDVVGRVGGDEFVVVSSPVASPDAAGVLASRLREAISQPATIASRRLSPSASVGVAWSAGQESAESLLRRADEAMYGEKRGSTR